MKNQILSMLWHVALRELHRIVSRPIYLFCMIGAPLFCYLFFTTLMGKGLPYDLPVGWVDLDNTSTTRSLKRTLDSFQMTKIVAHYPSMTEARNAMQRGEIYAFYYIPRSTTANALASRQPKVSFYTNNSYLIAGSLLYKDLRTTSELANGAVGRASLRAKGLSDAQINAFLQPIAIQAHALNNPWLNYSVYLCNTILPGIVMLLIFLLTIFSIGVEIKDNTSVEWMRMADNKVWVALLGKLCPHTVIFFLVTSLYDAYLYGFLHFPCNSGIGPMLFAALLMVLASQAFGVFLFSMLPAMRLAMSFASLWGVVSFSISGFTFPTQATHPILQGVANLFPLRHYFLIYVNQALNGYPMIYAWKQYCALFIFLILPLFVLKRLKVALLHYQYLP